MECKRQINANNTLTQRSALRKFHDIKCTNTCDQNVLYACHLHVVVM